MIEQVRIIEYLRKRHISAVGTENALFLVVVRSDRQGLAGSMLGHGSGRKHDLRSSERQVELGGSVSHPKNMQHLDAQRHRQ